MKSIELFAGAGGLALGTARSGFEHIAVIDWNEDSIRTLLHNKQNSVDYVRDWDIIKIDVNDYDFRMHEGKIDFVCGGPPCQPFSLGGKHRGYLDERNMFPQAVRAIREVRPQAFIFENVKGLLRRGFSEYFNYIIQQLENPELARKPDETWLAHSKRLTKDRNGKRSDLGYNVKFELLNAANYGVPQRRERVFIVGIRSDLNLNFRFPQHTHAENSLLFQKWITGEYWERHAIPRKKRPVAPSALKPRLERIGSLYPDGLKLPWKTVRDAIFDLPDPTKTPASASFLDHFSVAGARSYHGHTGSDPDEPAKTLKAGDHGVPGGENTLRLSNGDVRYFSLRECARIQTFPDNWRFQGSWTEIMRQLGNAVPVQLGETVSMHLAKALELASAAA